MDASGCVCARQISLRQQEKKRSTLRPSKKQTRTVSRQQPTANCLPQSVSEKVQILEDGVGDLFRMRPSATTGAAAKTAQQEIARLRFFLVSQAWSLTQKLDVALNPPTP